MVTDFKILLDNVEVAKNGFALVERNLGSDIEVAGVRQARLTIPLLILMWMSFHVSAQTVERVDVCLCIGHQSAQS